jgi:hypothetical protein
MTYYNNGDKRSKIMELKKIDVDFSICKVEDTTKVNFHAKYWFLSKTDEEISLVCETRFVPDNNIEVDDGWKAFRIQGILDFSLIGILSNISTVLAENKIGIFAISTFNTDYILVKEMNFKLALQKLKDAGYIIV